MPSIHTYRGIDTTPEVYLTVNRNRVKQYGSKYYLKAGQEFQLELINNSLRRALIKIHINGKSIHPAGLVIQPDSREFLERYIDDNRKFKFDTFMVDNNIETKRQRERNGKVRIEFYYERTRWTIDTLPYYYDDYTGNTIWTIGDVVTNYNASSNMNINSHTPRFSSTSQVETGRVGKGSHSNQSFGTTTGDFNDSPDYVIEFQILPESQKPVEMKSIRTYCPECGTRIRKASWKFCPNCGTCL